LIDKAHQLGMKVMIDVVYNHTAHDSKLVKEHPEWFHQDQNGIPVTTVPEWSDVIDLNYESPALYEHLIRVLQDWAVFGVDGFRCDVASLVPLDFWQRARSGVSEVKEGVIWMAESVHSDFIAQRRFNGLRAYSDGELYSAFDVLYDYDIWPVFQAAVEGVVPSRRYLEMLHWQDCIYPANYIKMRCVENHDQERIMKLAPDPARALAWTAFTAFNKGPFMIYAGQESGALRRPSLFECDKVVWDDYKYQDFLGRLAFLKKENELIKGKLYLLDSAPAIQAVWVSEISGIYGVFNISGRMGKVCVQLPDGLYEDMTSPRKVTVQGGEVELPEAACILRYTCLESPQPLHFTMIGDL
jgi:glycosidase